MVRGLARLGKGRHKCFSNSHNVVPLLELFAFIFYKVHIEREKLKNIRSAYEKDKFSVTCVDVLCYVRVDLES